MGICNVIVGCVSGFAVGYIDLLILWNNTRNVLHGKNKKVFHFVTISFLVRLPLAGLLFYVFLMGLHINVVDFFVGIALSLLAVSMQMAARWQTLMERAYVGNS
jgi:uncharacterized membrane protein YkgB